MQCTNCVFVFWYHCYSLLAHVKTPAKMHFFLSGRPDELRNKTVKMISIIVDMESSYFSHFLFRDIFRAYDRFLRFCATPSFHLKSLRLLNGTYHAHYGNHGKTCTASNLCTILRRTHHIAWSLLQHCWGNCREHLTKQSGDRDTGFCTIPGS